MKNLFNSLKNMLGGDQDPRMSTIKKAMRSLGYDCKVSDDKTYAFCEFSADNNLRYKSEVSLCLTEEGISLTYTIYAKRIHHDAPFQDPKSKAALKGYHYQSGRDELSIWKHLPQDTTKAKDMAEAIRQIRATALAVYTDAGIPEDPNEAIDFNGVSAKTIKEKLQLYKCFRLVLVSEERVYSESTPHRAPNGDRLWSFGVNFSRNGANGIDCKFYYTTLPLPQETAEKLADRFGNSFNLKGRLSYEPTETSFTISANTLSGQLVEKYIDLMMDAIRDLWSDIDQAVVEVYNRALEEAKRQKAIAETKRQEAIAEAKRQKAIAEAKAREETRQRKLNEGYTLTLRGGTTIREIQGWFGEDYPYLDLHFYLVKTAQKVHKGDSITPLNEDLTLDQVRSFRGECQVGIYGKSTPQSLEKELRSKSGLVVKVCYKDSEGKNYYIGPNSNEYTMCIYDINEQFAEQGCERLY